MKFEHEENAMRGDPVPKSLTGIGQSYYIGLRYLYAACRIGAISRDEAAKEKKLLQRDAAQASKSREFERKCWENSARRTMAAERAMTMYRKNRTLENADVLVDRLEWLHDECSIPVKKTEHGANCPACGSFFNQDHANRKPVYCENCGCRLVWDA